MDAVFKSMFEWIVLRLLWGPWNLFIGVVWTITDDVAEEVALARLMFGLIGTIWLCGGIIGLLYIPEIVTVRVSTQLGVLAAYSGVYYALAVCLKGVLSGRDENIFSL